MLKIERSRFGPVDEYRLVNTDTGERASIVPAWGASLRELILRFGSHAVDVIDGQEMPIDPWFKSAVLMPFPGRIRNGTYDFEKVQYQLPLNFPSQNHSIHGFLYSKPFSVVNCRVFRGAAVISLQYDYEGELPGYPFPFSARVHYSLRKGRGLTCAFRLCNRHTGTIPAGIGWHPYYKLGGKVDELQLRLPTRFQLELDSTLIPTGRVLPVKQFRKHAKIGSAELDSTFIIETSHSESSAVLYDPSADIHLELWQDSGVGKFQYMQVFVPPGRRSVAIEPMTCCANAFNNGLGRLDLQPGEEISASCGIKAGTGQGSCYFSEHHS